MKQTSYSYGLSSEGVALHYLTKLGFHLLKQRYKTAYGELDLIMTKEQEIVFFEVKARKKFYDLATIITPKQLLRNYSAAEFFLALHQEYLSYSARFDLIVISGEKVAAHIDNIILPAPY